MPRVARPSLRRVSTLDTIEEASSDSIASSRFSTVPRRISVGFSVNLPVNERPKRRHSDAIEYSRVIDQSSPRKQEHQLNAARASLLEQRRSMVRRASSRFRQSLCAIPQPKKQKCQQPRSSATYIDEPCDDSSEYAGLPSYARPTAASMAKRNSRKARKR